MAKLKEALAEGPESDHLCQKLLQLERQVCVVMKNPSTFGLDLQHGSLFAILHFRFHSKHFGPVEQVAFPDIPRVKAFPHLAQLAKQNQLYFAGY